MNGAVGMSESVLIVDDSLTVRMHLVDAFAGAGFRALGCGTAQDARDILSRERVDAVILDVILPDGDGIELLAEVRNSSSSRAAVLVLSAESEIRDRIRGLRMGADEYVGKPFDTAYVIARVSEILRSRTPPPSPETTVLVIDDSATFRETLRKAFDEAGYAVFTAETGEDGLRAAASRRPDAIIVDGVLPGIDGATVVRRIRLDAALRGIPCLLLTASENRGAELRALDSGADAFVRKDDGTAVILARLGAVLRGSAARVPASDTASLAGPKKILAVDDSLTYLHELSSLLHKEGYDVISAQSGEQALELLAVQPVDCVLLDLIMPGLGGEETCRQIKSAAVVRDIPVVMLTALEDRGAMIKGLGAGADDYLPKSSEFEVLKARVRVQLRRKQYEDENRKFRAEIYRHEVEAAEARAAKDLAEARAALAGELERKNKELEAFSYSVSHDLRAPLRSIDGFSQLLLERYAVQLDEKGRHYLDVVRSSAQRMGELIDGLLLLSRVGRRDLEMANVDLSRIAHQVVADLQKRDAERSIEVSIDDGLYACADRLLLKIVLENLLGNAWKFTSKTERPRIDFGRMPASAHPTFFVRDNGAGFDMAYSEKLFSPFQRLHLESDFQGTGIGLATVYRVIDRHCGRVWAEGAVGQGATFFFSLPLRSGLSE